MRSSLPPRLVQTRGPHTISGRQPGEKPVSGSVSDEKELNLPSGAEIKGAVRYAGRKLKQEIRQLLGDDIPDLSRGGIMLPRKRIGDDHLRLFLVGDTGTGKSDQMKVAAAMTVEAMHRKPHFSVNLGDLIYENGVESEHDPRLKEQLSEPYDHVAPMYIMAGNHDHRGDVDALVRFAEGDANTVMPARYYGFGFEFGGKTADFFVLDTQTLEKDPAQLKWLETAFPKSDADYKIVLGHHPIHSGGEHGDNDFMKELVLPIIDGKAQVAAAGHDHDQQLLKTEGGTLVLVSGAGGKTRATGSTDQTLFAAAGLGFSALELGPKGLTLDVLDGHNRIIHQHEKPLRERQERGRKDLLAGLPWLGAARSELRDR